MGKNTVVVVPTYNRPRFLRRLLKYCHLEKLTSPILVADGSSHDNRIENASVIAEFTARGMDVVHFVPPEGSIPVSSGTCQFGYGPRLDLALRDRTEPFIHMVCDDCLVSRQFVEEAASILERDDQTSVVVGPIWTYLLDAERKTTALYGALQSLNVSNVGGTRPGRTATERLALNAQDYMLNTSWATHRRENLIPYLRTATEACRQLLDIDERAGPPGQAEEFGLNFLFGYVLNLFSLVQGNVRPCPYLMLAHQYHAENWGLYLGQGPQLSEVMAGPYWSAMLTPYLDFVATSLVQKDGLTPEASRSVVLAALGLDISRKLEHASRTSLNKQAPSVTSGSSAGWRQSAKRLPGLTTVVRQVRRVAQLRRVANERSHVQRLAQASDIVFLRHFIEDGNEA